MNRQLAGPGFEQRAGCRHNVAQIPVFEGTVNFLTHPFIIDVQLNASTRRAKRRVLQRRKAGFAHHALEHHAASHMNLQCQRLQLFVGFVLVVRKQCLCPVRGLDVVGESHAFALGLLLAHRLELFAALNDELVFILWGWSGEGCRR